MNETHPSETALQHHVEIGPDPHAAAEVVAALIRSDQRDGKDLPGGLPPEVVYKEPHGPDRIPAPATVAHEGSAACGALSRAEATKEKATHVGVCRAIGHDGKPVHHAFLVAAAKPGELPLITGPDGKSLGPVDLKRVRDPSQARGMNCGCHVPSHLYKEASFAAIHPDYHHTDNPSGAAAALARSTPAERAAAGVAYQGRPRAHMPETEAGRTIAQTAALAARAVTPQPGDRPRHVHELHPHPDVRHPEADRPHPPQHPAHLERATTELVASLHTIASGRNPHPLPEDPPVTEEHANAARAMVGTLVNAARATPAHEHFDDPARQAEVLAIVPAAEQVTIRAKMLNAAASLEHLDGSLPENDAALTVASEIDALLPGVLPKEVGHSLRARRVRRQANCIGFLADINANEPDSSLATSLALMVALDDWSVGCPWDGRRPPPPDHPHRPVKAPFVPRPAADPNVSGVVKHTRDIGNPGQTATTLANEYGATSRPGWLEELKVANAGQPHAASSALPIGSSWTIPQSWLPSSWNDPEVGRGGHFGVHGFHGFGLRGRGLGPIYGWPSFDYLDCGPVIDPLSQADIILGDVGSIFWSGPAAFIHGHPHEAEWRRQYGDRFWEDHRWHEVEWQPRIAEWRRQYGDRFWEDHRWHEAHPRATEWRGQYGARFWEHPRWREDRRLGVAPAPSASPPSPQPSSPPPAGGSTRPGAPPPAGSTRPGSQTSPPPAGGSTRPGAPPPAGSTRPGSQTSPPPAGGRTEEPRRVEEPRRAEVRGEEFRKNYGEHYERHPQAAEWRHQYGDRFWEDHRWRERFDRGAFSDHVSERHWRDRFGRDRTGPIVIAEWASDTERRHWRDRFGRVRFEPIIVDEFVEEVDAPIVVDAAPVVIKRPWYKRWFPWFYRTEDVVIGAFRRNVSVGPDHHDGWFGPGETPQIDPSVSGWDYRGRDRVVNDWAGASALRRYWNDPDFRSQIDSGQSVDGWNLDLLYEMIDPGGAAAIGADSSDVVLGGTWVPGHWSGTAGNKTWIPGHMSGSTPTSALASASSYRYRPRIVRRTYGGQSYGGQPQPIIIAGQEQQPLVVDQPAPSVDQYGNTLDQYGNPIAGPDGGPVMGPYGPMTLTSVPAQVALAGIPMDLLDVPICGVDIVREGIEGTRRAAKGRAPCRRCSGG